MNTQRLFFIREEFDLKQTDMASILNVNRVNISNWENGKEIIPLDKLIAYSDYFNVSIDYLLSLTNKKNEFKKNPLNKEIVGNNIKQVRLNNNLTQKDLANLLNTTQSTISDYENGVNLILTSFAYQICVKYNISMDWLCGRK